MGLAKDRGSRVSGPDCNFEPANSGLTRLDIPRSLLSGGGRPLVGLIPAGETPAGDGTGEVATDSYRSSTEPRRIEVPC